jgi:putative ABC transport system ATP-binding protein
MVELAARCTRVLRVYRSPSGEVQALRGVDASFRRGALIALVGPSGSGKSSLLRVLAGLDPVTGGTVEVEGVIVTDLSPRRLREFRNRHVGFLWQRPADNVVAHLTVRQNLALAAAGRSVETSIEALGDVGLGEVHGRLAGSLSGGEQQRLGIALAGVGDRPVLLADEPTAELDRRSATAVIDLLAERNERGASVIVATHDPRVVERADEVLTLIHGTVAGYGRAGALVAIDTQGRVQLTNEAIAVLGADRAVVEVVDDAVILRRPPT